MRTTNTKFQGFEHDNQIGAKTNSPFSNFALEWVKLRTMYTRASYDIAFTLDVENVGCCHAQLEYFLNLPINQTRVCNARGETRCGKDKLRSRGGMRLACRESRSKRGQTADDAW